MSAKGNHHHLIAIIAQAYRLSTVHCRVTRYSQRVLGHLTWYSVPANEISFDKNNQAKRLCLSTHITPGKIFSLSTWWLQQAFWSPFWSIITHMPFKYDLFFKWHQSGPFNVICIIAVLVKAHGASCQFAPSNGQTSWTHEVQYCQQQCSLWGMKMTNPTKLLKLGVLIPFLLLVSLTALVVVVGVVVAGVWCSCSQTNTFSCYSWPASWQLLHNGGMKTISRTCAIIQIKYVLPKLCHLPQYSNGSWDPTNQVLGFTPYQGLGIWDLYSYWGQC